jgi:hypothetical protein
VRLGRYGALRDIVPKRRRCASFVSRPRLPQLSRRPCRSVSSWRGVAPLDAQARRYPTKARPAPLSSSRATGRSLDYWRAGRDNPPGDWQLSAKAASHAAQDREYLSLPSTGRDHRSPAGGSHSDPVIDEAALRFQRELQILRKIDRAEFIGDFGENRLWPVMDDDARSGRLAEAEQPPPR